MRQMHLGLSKSEQRVRRRFRAYWRRLDRPARLWRLGRRALAIGAIAGSCVALGYVALVTLSPWPPLVTLRHLAAAPNCDAARAVGLAPAWRGEPGYYRSHDRDNDGWACEPLLAVVHHPRGRHPVPKHYSGLTTMYVYTRQ